MSLLWPQGVPGRQDPYRKIILGLVVVLATVGSLIVVSVIVLSVLGCGTIAECADQTGFGSIFSKVSWLAPLCLGFLIFGVAMAILGGMYWFSILDRRGYSGRFVRNRRPPE